MSSHVTSAVVPRRSLRPRITSRGNAKFPAIIDQAGPTARTKFVDFFTFELANPLTRKSYSYAVREFLDWCDVRDLSLEELSPSVVASYLEALSTHLAGSTVASRRTALRTFFAFLVSSEVLRSNPVAPGLRSLLRTNSPGCPSEPFISPCDSESVEEFLARIRPRMLHILRSFRIPPQDSEDLIQEALLFFVTSSTTIKNPDAWVTSTLFNRCAMYWRSRRGYPLLRTTEPELLSQLLPQRPDPAFTTFELRADLEPLLRQLPARQRLVLRLRFVCGMAPLDIADAMGYHVASVRKVVARALERLASLWISNARAVARRDDERAT
jgi:RNA polymerase sigma factor (sigma-70 family)